MNCCCKNGLMSTAVAAAVGIGTIAFAAYQDQDAARAPEKARVGEKAPAFTLTSTEGKEISLDDFEGKIVVLEWANPDCPVWERLYDQKILPETQKKAKEMDEDLMWLAVNSTHYTNAEQNNDWIEKYDLEIPFLLDTEGEVGRLYDARTTPHMYVIDTEGVLRYAGAIDDDPHGAKFSRGEERTNYVLNALEQIKNDTAVSPDTTKPYGCGVKYKR